MTRKKTLQPPKGHGEFVICAIALHYYFVIVTVFFKADDKYVLGTDLRSFTSSEP